jgi:hypothetical protein
MPTPRGHVERPASGTHEDVGMAPVSSSLSLNNQRARLLQ